MKQKTILYCASTTGHLKNFHLPYLQALQNLGYRIIACGNRAEVLPGVDDFLEIPFQKSITSPKNLQNIWKVYQYLKQEQVDLVSVHTALAAVVVRAAIRLLPPRKRPLVMNTSHGYLFRRRDGLKKWKYLLPEKLLAPVTDRLLVMNEEDMEIAEREGLTKGETVLIPGMGVDFSRFDIATEKEELRSKYGYGREDVLYVFAGEFSHRKNQEELITAFARAEKKMPHAKLILAGTGDLRESCKEQVMKLNLTDRVLFPGQVTDMPELYHCCDVCVSASLIEGLPFNVMEAMHCGLPCILSNTKGHKDLVQPGINGLLYDREPELAGKMIQLYENRDLRAAYGKRAKENVNKYALSVVKPQILKEYEELLS